MGELAQDSTNVNPLALLFLLVMSVIMVRASRPYAAVALLATAVFVPLGQQVVVLRLHFHFFRLLILIGFLRLAVRGEMKGFAFNLVDKLFIWWALSGMVLGSVRDATLDAFINNLGNTYNALGAYFLVRMLVRDPGEMLVHLRFLNMAVIIVAACMCLELATHRNVFSIFGGVPEMVELREGRLRCQGPFRHPIFAGTFAATLFPLLIGYRFQLGTSRWRVYLGMLGSVIATGASASSGALLTFLAAMAGIVLWPLRRRMRMLRVSALAIVIILAVFMNAPVWYLISKISDLAGGTGWHRSYLIDQAVKHFGEWWFIGTSTTAHWAPAGQVLTINPKMMDITNHYIVQGIRGGILHLGLFVALIACCFKIVGNSLRQQGTFDLDERLRWAIGVSLAAHCGAFISISYFDQIEVFWFWLLAVISAFSSQLAACQNRIEETATDEAVRSETVKSAC